MNRFVASLSIGKRITLGFFLLILLFLGVMITVELAGIPGTTVHGKFTANRDKHLSDLELASGILSERISSWFVERRIDVDGLAESPLLRKALENRKTVSMAEVTGELNGFMKSHPSLDYVAVLDLADASVLASSGTLDTAGSAADVGIPAETFSRLTLPGYQETIEITLLHDKKPHLRIVRQILSTDSSGRVTALLVAESDMENALRPLIWSVRNSIISHDLQCVIALKVGDDIAQIHVSKEGIKHLTLHLPDITLTAPIQRFISGMEGPYEGPDQFGNQVLSFYRQVNIDRGTSLGLIIKQDSESVYKAIHDELKRQGVLWLALLAGGFAFCFVLAQQIVRPIKALSAVAGKIGEGDFTARAVEKDQTEIGQLAMVFNRMVEKIQNWQIELEAQVENRTRELLAATERLQEQNEELQVNEEELRCQNEDLTSAEAMLRASEEQYRLLVNNLSSGIVVHAPDTSIIFANAMALTLLGLTRDQIKGKTAMDPAWCFLRETATPMPFDEYPVNQVLSTGKPISDVVVGIRHTDGSDPIWVLCNAYPVSTAGGTLQQIVVLFSDITRRKQAEDALNKRLVALTQPLGNTTISFAELFNIEDVQRLQDEFAKATGVASIITDTNGIPLTAPSNFTRLCNEIIRKTEKGCANCFKSDAVLGRLNPDGPTIQPCLSGGLWDAGAGIAVGGQHIANWLIGQVRDESHTEEAAAAYAREIGVDEALFMAALREVPSMSHTQFERIARALFTLATQLSTTAFQNVQQARLINERKQAEEKILFNNTRLKSLVRILQYPAETIQGFLDYALNEAIGLTSSRIGYIYFYDEERQEFELNSWSNDVMKECAVTNPQTIYHLDKTGFWGEAVRQRRTIILNEFAAENPLKKGYPEGHVHLVRFMSVPVISNERIVAVVGVANKNSEYDESDVLQLTLLMDAVWQYVEKKRGETALRQERTLSQTYLDTVETMIVVLDADGMITTINRKALLVLGYGEDELIGKFWFSTCLPQPAGMEVIYPHFLKIIAGEFGHAEYYENEVVTKSGEIRQIAWHNALLRDDQGRVSGTISAGDDITDSNRAEEERLKLESQLQQAQKMESVGRLAGGVAHDFNNMLSVILGHAELGLMKIAPDNPLAADLKEIAHTAERSADLTRQLLAFARKQTVAPKELDLNETIASMLKMLQRLIGEAISLTWQPAADLWPIKMDRSQIDQILANLCVNARDAIEDTGLIAIGTENCTIDADYCSNHLEAMPGEYVRLSVSDSGAGMDREAMTHIFEPFYTTKEFGKGTGLGLATVYGAVKQNNGFITLYSEPGQGTTFSIYLPRLEDAHLRLQRESDSAPVPRGKETILLVEDEPAILNLTARMLEGQGYTVLKATTPGEALQTAREQSGTIHLLMTDVIMPGMNGRDLMKATLSLYPQIKQLFMSGYTADVIAHHGVLDDGVHFIQKPFSLSMMAAKVREVLDAG